MKVLGIDPGLANTGWSVVEPAGKDKFIIRDTGLIKTDKKDDFPARLSLIVDSLIEVADRNEVKFVSAEDIFFTKNISSCIEVAKVIGSFTYAFKKKGIGVYLYTPTKIKQTVTGGGNADKKAMEFMVMQQLVDSRELKNDHQADSAAAAITFFIELKNDLLFEKY